LKQLDLQSVTYYSGVITELEWTPAGHCDDLCRSWNYDRTPDPE